MALDAAINFGKAEVSQGYDDSATSVALETGHGARFPDPSTDGAFNVVWFNVSDYADPADDPNVEIVRVTARSTDTLTVTRAQESTSASTKNESGKTYLMVVVITKKMIDDIQTELDGKYGANSDPTFDDMTADKATFNETVSFDAETDNGNSSTADTIDWRLGNKQKSTLTGNVTFTFTAPAGPCNLILKLVQDGTGSRTVTWPAAVLWPGGTAPTLSTAASAVDIVSFYYDGTNYHGQAGLSFS